ncbi:MAG TPA: 3-deoxy-D-manno-octulosonic acid transferase [bacterium]|nr:3-deoxy-D-manno-octulosonic acid transferase [bacterium]
MIILYTALTWLLVIITYPVGLLLALFGRSQLLNHFKLPTDIPQDGNIRLWIHAASVGEAGIAVSMAGEVKKSCPEALVFISTITVTGLEKVHLLNKSSAKNLVDYTFLAPIDCPVITQKFVKYIIPTSFILVETEIWPSLIYSLHKKGVPITIINGKLSRRAFRRYMFFRKSIKIIVQKISLFCVQSRTFAKRFTLLGVPSDRIKIIGNIKFDSLPEPLDYDTEAIRLDMGIPLKVKVFVAGSTRPGEEEVLARSFTNILEKYPDTVMILVPRHLNRVSEVEKILDDNGLKYVKRTSGERLDSFDCSILLLDTMGELVSAYACADIAFVGGSLGDFGGHNPMEPAAFGIPVLFGPYMEQTGSKELLSKGAAALVHDEEELAGMIISLFKNYEKSQQMGQAGTAVVHHYKGTLERTLEYMKNYKLI